MGNLEKYGVLALIFVIVLILTVAIWNGPSPERSKPAPPEPTQTAPESPAPAVPPSNVSNPPAPSDGRVVVPDANPLETKPQFRTYVVAKNDTLSTIAKKTLGASSRWTEIERANEGLDSKKLKIGQRILIPVGAPPAEESTGEVKAAKARTRGALASR